MKRGVLGPLAILVGVLLLGAVAGAGGAVAYMRHETKDLASGPRFRDRARVRGLARVLDLDDSQRDRVKAILEKHQGERQAAFAAMVDRCGEDLKKQKSAIDAEIRATLTPAQQSKFDALVQKQNDWFSPGVRPPR